MRAQKLRWLTFLGVLGLLGLALKHPLLCAPFGFFAFIVFFWYDERAEANVGRAAAIAYGVTLVAFMAVFVRLTFTLNNQAVGRATAGDVITSLAEGFAIVYMLHILSFAASYIYFQLRGN